MAPPAKVVPNQPPSAHRLHSDNLRVQRSITQLAAAAVVVCAQNGAILPHGDEVAEKSVRVLMDAGAGVPYTAVPLDEAKAALTTLTPAHSPAHSITGLNGSERDSMRTQTESRLAIQETSDGNAAERGKKRKADESLSSLESISGSSPEERAEAPSEEAAHVKVQVSRAIAHPRFDQCNVLTNAPHATLIRRQSFRSPVFRPALGPWPCAVVEGSRGRGKRGAARGVSGGASSGVRHDDSSNIGFAPPKSQKQRKSSS